jgi:hypothetical protein
MRRPSIRMFQPIAVICYNVVGFIAMGSISYKIIIQEVSDENTPKVS